MVDDIDDTVSKEPFLKRWSEKKLDDTPEEAEALPVVEETPEIPPDLPDVDTLDTDSDYTGFLKDGVPEELKRMALRTLWRSSPELANLDGLNDYDDDYSIVDTVVGALKSAYQPGRGYEDEAPEPEPKTTKEKTTVEQTSAPVEEDSEETVDENVDETEDGIVEPTEDEESPQ